MQGRSLADALLEPTRIYVKPILSALGSTPAIKAIAHITGGGITEKIPRVLPSGLGAEIDLTSFVRPAVFDWLQEAGGVAEDEMLRTFNCGIGMTVIVASNDVDAVQSVLTQAGETVSVIGRTVASPSGEVEFKGSFA